MAWQLHPGVVPRSFGSALRWSTIGSQLWRRQAGRGSSGQLLAIGDVAAVRLSLGLEMIHT